MAQAKRGPKAKPKDVEPLVEQPIMHYGMKVNEDILRSERVWKLASDLLVQKAKLSAVLTPAAIVEIANWSKMLDRELDG